MSAGSVGEKKGRQKVNTAFLARQIQDNCDFTSATSFDRPIVYSNYVSPISALNGAHLVWTEADPRRNISNIFLGPRRSAATKYQTLVEEFNIRAIVNCTPRVPCYHQNEQNFSYCLVPINDEVGADILTYLEGVTLFLQTHLQQKGNSVLVHCEMGASRSATVVMAYLMRYHMMTREESYVNIKILRPQVNPNPGFWKQLELWKENIQKLSIEKAKVLDSDWGRRSSALYGTCRDFQEAKMLRHICFADIDGKAADPDHVLCMALDFVWARGVLTVDVDWLFTLCVYLEEQNTTDIQQITSKVLEILTDSESEFGRNWACEIYSNQVEKIKRIFASQLGSHEC